MTTTDQTSQPSRTYRLGVLLGEAIRRGKGYGTETASLMRDFGFTALGLHNIMLTVSR